MYGSGRQRSPSGMTRGQITVLAVMAVLAFGIVIGGGYYVLSDSGLIGGSEDAPATRSPVTPTVTSEGESQPAPSATSDSGGKLPPAWTPTPFGLDEIDYVQWAIQLSDLPLGFEKELHEKPDTESGLIGEDGKGILVNSFFYTRATEDPQFIFGVAGLVLEHEQQEFDANLSQPDLLTEQFIDPFDHNGILEQDKIGDLEDLGDIAAGYNYLVDMEGVELRFDLIAFRRDIAGVVIVMGYADGFSAAVSIRDLAYVLDQRILPTLPVNP